MVKGSGFKVSCTTVAHNRDEEHDPQTKKKKNKKQLTKEAVWCDKSYNPPHPTNCISVGSGRGLQHAPDWNGCRYWLLRGNKSKLLPRSHRGVCGQQ
jgi:hypothetical protein